MIRDAFTIRKLRTDETELLKEFLYQAPDKFVVKRHYGNERADMQHYVEEQIALAGYARYMLGNREVSAAGYRQKLGKSLHYALNYRVKNCHKLSPLCTGKSPLLFVIGIL